MDRVSPDKKPPSGGFFIGPGIQPRRWQRCATQGRSRFLAKSGSENNSNFRNDNVQLSGKALLLATRDG
jgi:hypothetical protein